MTACLLLLTCMLQVHLLLASKPHQDPGSCRRANFEYGCEGSECTFSVGWRTEAEDQLVIKLTALIPEQKDVWAAITLAQKGVFTCQWNNDSELTPVNCSLTGGGDEVQQDDCLSGNTTYDSHLLECSFILPVTDSWSWLLSEPVSIQFTSGSDSGSEASGHSDCPCDFSDCLNTCSCGVVTDNKCHSALSLLLIRSHAILMMITFLLLLPTGAMISRYSRHTFPHSWFRAHALTNSSAVLLMALGLAAVLGHTGGAFTVGVHQVVGIICVSLVLFQALCGFLRPVTGISLQRRVFNLVHRIVGATILGLGALAMLLGAILYQHSVYIATVVVLVLAVIVEAALIVTMEIIRRRNHIISPPVGYHRVLGREGDGGTGEGEGDSESDRELFVRGGGGGGKRGPKTSSDQGWLSKPAQLHAHTTTKRVLATFIIQAFLFSAIIGILISYGYH